MIEQSVATSGSGKVYHVTFRCCTHASKGAESRYLTHFLPVEVVTLLLMFGNVDVICAIILSVSSEHIQFTRYGEVERVFGRVIKQTVFFQRAPHCITTVFRAEFNDDMLHIGTYRQ